MASLATGDVEGKVGLLKRDLAQLRYPHIFDEEGARRGAPNALTPIFAHALHRYSRFVAALAAARGLPGRRGRRFVECVFKIAREDLGVRAGMKASQFLSEVIAACNWRGMPSPSTLERLGN